jgi:hypothetical protein
MCIGHLLKDDHRALGGRNESGASISHCWTERSLGDTDRELWT